MDVLSFSIILITFGGTVLIYWCYLQFAYKHDPDAKKPAWLRNLQGENLVSGVQNKKIKNKLRTSSVLDFQLVKTSTKKRLFFRNKEHRRGLTGQIS